MFSYEYIIQLIANTAILLRACQTVDSEETLSNESALKLIIHFQPAFLIKSQPYLKSLAKLALLLKNFVMGGHSFLTLCKNFKFPNKGVGDFTVCTYICSMYIHIYVHSMHIMCA